MDDYLRFFKLHREPFASASPEHLYYASRQHTDALKRLHHAVASYKGLTVLLGDVGRGKTTLARRLLASLNPAAYEATLLVMMQSDVGMEALLQRMAFQLGVSKPQIPQPSLLGPLYERLLHIQGEGRRAVVLIDEAQMMARQEVMEGFRGLLNWEGPDHRPLLTLVFFGLPALEANLGLDPSLAQRVALRYVLQALDPDGTTAYVQHRLQAAGACSALFSKAALDEVHRFCHGIPRVINTLCDNVLLELFFAGQHLAEASHVERAAIQLNLQGTGEAPGAPEKTVPSFEAPTAAWEGLGEGVTSHPGSQSSALDLQAEAIAAHVATDILDPTLITPLHQTPGSQSAPQNLPRAMAWASEDTLVETETQEPCPEKSVHAPGDGWVGVKPASGYLGNTVWASPGPPHVAKTAPQNVALEDTTQASTPEPSSELSSDDLSSELSSSSLTSPLFSDEAFTRPLRSAEIQDLLETLKKWSL